MASKRSVGKTRIDLASVLGLVVAVGSIVGGLTLEGGSYFDIAQLTAGVIVLGGTMGAVMLTTPMSVLRGAFRRFGTVFIERIYSPDDTIEHIVSLAHRARRGGMVSLESDLDAIEDPFLRKALSLGVDGTDVQDIRAVMSLELETEEIEGKAEARVFDVAGGYAPTIGIIGAVLGLIQVMKHLEDISMVGHGIAVAFVATIYGVAIANLLFLPTANKLRARIHQAIRAKEMVLEGVISIVQGAHPAVIESKLEAFAKEKKAPELRVINSRGRRAA